MMLAIFWSIDCLLARGVNAHDSEAFLAELEKKGIPFVLIDRYFPNQPFSYIAIDNYKSVFDAVTHLIDNGRKHIALINYNTNLFHLQERTRGYKEAVKLGKGSKRKVLIQEVGIAEILNFQPKGSKSKPYQVKQVRAVIVRYKLGVSDVE